MDQQIILVVEDNPTLQKLVGLMAKRLRVEAKIAGCCKDALALVESGEHFALILMDWSLPDTNGLECADAVRQMRTSANNHTPIVAMTANVLAGDRERCLDAGMDDYLAKPFSFNEFCSMLNRWLGSVSTTAEGRLPSPMNEMQPPQTA